MYGEHAEVEALVGKTLTKVEVNSSDDEIKFYCDDGTVYGMAHQQDCCESVTIEDVCGEWDDLIGQPILMAEKVTHNDENPEGVKAPDYQESFTWTFYKFATNKGYVTLRWYGESNGYYSEEVDFWKLDD